MGKDEAKTHIPEYMKGLLNELINKAESKGETTAARQRLSATLRMSRAKNVEARLLSELLRSARTVVRPPSSATMDEARARAVWPLLTPCRYSRCAGDDAQRFSHHCRIVFGL
ncbi:hypothetical protein GKODMF_04700 [Candidatus Electrothrix gigas]